jgi:DNA-binding HxlR family transcriptional regulator
VGDKWTLLIVRDLAAGPRRFVELQRVLPGISTEQLRSRLNRMVADGMLTRKRYREVPPRVDYELTDRAHDLMPILGELARWGYEWAWGPPRSSEAVDIGAIFRLTAGLITPAAELQGTLVFTVDDTRTTGESNAYTIGLSADRVTLQERIGEQPDGHASGDTDAWVAAFSPQQDRSRLRFTGDRPLAERLLDGLAAASARSVARIVAA